MVLAEVTDDFLPNFFLSFLASILNFYAKCKNAYISETASHGAITARVSAEPSDDFSKNLFSCHFGSHLQFLCKKQKPFISKVVRHRVIWAKFLPPAYSQNELSTFPKNHFSDMFGGDLEFFVKLQNSKNIFISEKDKAVAAKFFTPMVVELTGDISPLFGSHLEFLHKKQKCIYMLNSVR